MNKIIKKWSLRNSISGIYIGIFNKKELPVCLHYLKNSNRYNNKSAIGKMGEGKSFIFEANI